MGNPPGLEPGILPSVGDGSVPLLHASARADGGSGTKLTIFYLGRGKKVIRIIHFSKCIEVSAAKIFPRTSIYRSDEKPETGPFSLGRSPGKVSELQCNFTSFLGYLNRVRLIQLVGGTVMVFGREKCPGFGGCRSSAFGTGADGSGQFVPLAAVEAGSRR